MVNMFKRIKKEWNGKYGWALKLGSAILLFSLGSCTFSDGIQDGLDNEPKTEETNQIIIGDITYTKENLITYVENLEKHVEELDSQLIDRNYELSVKNGEIEKLEKQIEELQKEEPQEEVVVEEETIIEDVEEEYQEEVVVEEEIEPLTYEDLARNPEENEGKPVEFYGEVIQVVEGDLFNRYRFMVDGDYDQIILLEIPSFSLEERILEGDLLTVSGVSQGNITYTTVLGASVTVPSVLITDFTLEN